MAVAGGCAPERWRREDVQDLSAAIAAAELIGRPATESTAFAQAGVHGNGGLQRDSQCLVTRCRIESSFARKSGVIVRRSYVCRKIP